MSVTAADVLASRRRAVVFAKGEVLIANREVRKSKPQTMERSIGGASNTKHL
jgi:hypothetical protein